MDVLDWNHVASMQGVGGGNLASKHLGGGSADPPLTGGTCPLFWDLFLRRLVKFGWLNGSISGSADPLMMSGAIPLPCGPSLPPLEWV